MKTNLIKLIGIIGLVVVGKTAGASDLPWFEPYSPGNAVFGSACEKGSLGDFQSVKLELYDCAEAGGHAEIVGALESYILQADCRKKTLIIRTVDRLVDAAWDTMPDGSFYITWDGDHGKLRAGQLHADCNLPLSMELWGKMDCTDSEKPVIRLESIWWLNKAGTSNACEITSKCYLHGTATLHQCQ